MLRIGSIKLDVPFFQSPISGYTDYPMRSLARSFGAPLTFAGVMLAKSAACPRVLTRSSFRPREDEHPVGAQIIGNEPKVMAKAAVELVRAGYDLIDLNFACPAPKVLRRKRGGYLLKEPARAVEIFRTVRDSVDCPVTVKLRTSYGNGDKSRANFWQIAEEISDYGVDALVIHGRTVLDRFSGSADWDFLARVKRRFPHKTIIGSGDLFEPGKIISRLENSGLDGVALARGAIGNPWIFRHLRALFAGKAAPAPPTLAQQRKIMLEHFELICHEHPVLKAVRLFRKFLVAYCKLHPARKNAQLSLLAAKNKQQLLTTMNQWYTVAIKIA